MAVAIAILAVLIGYLPSKYCPRNLALLTKLQRCPTPVQRGIAVVGYSASLLLFIKNFDIATGILVWLFTISLILCVVILAVPYWVRSAYAFIAIAMFSVFIDIFAYAS
jgi:hypothetical protein